MDAMNYEHFIRRAYNCGRYGVEGANADIYRRLERKSAVYKQALNEIENNKPRSWNQDIKDICFDYGVAAGEVAAFISDAIHKVESDYDNQLTDEQKGILEDCKSSLVSPTIENIKETLETSDQVMKDLGLYPG